MHGNSEKKKKNIKKIALIGCAILFFIFSTAIISAFVFAYYCQHTAWYHWVALSAGVVVFGTFGDLIESLIKRSVEFKDSGSLLPGHGGFLDRFDSLLLAVYAMLFYMQLFIQN